MTLPMFSLKGKTSLITGGSGGIGFSIAKALAASGSNVGLLYGKNKKALDYAQELREKYNVKAEAYPCAIEKRSAVIDTTNRAVEELGGRLDIMVANAGIGIPHLALEDKDEDTWTKVVGVNLNGAYYTAQAAGHHFKKQGSGSLIFTASMSAHIANWPQQWASYHATKGAVKHLARALAVEWAPFARVNSVSPGYIDTDLTLYADEKLRKQWKEYTPQGRIGLPEELVGAYIYLASDASSFCTGTDIVVDGGYTSR
ncbi:sorbose reductase [Schizosaccharomyces cryophilus OY26]|uniref:Sorbose reductase n=1 Tax=Schizosaccharomyces cryophilus (strain OY26 / ATCC MYA-4695 / CBS 11777 / NBRC 106824 / NRRL Y48691) TaxID=653667 RepID=S9X4R2_SCHCR|nr:sorbose reductase [Schizosaccharomyces cryophilus OY26]EPY52067.1 sorbose reductase [Schizosaccharomyces cryophilus OY26]